MNLTDEKINGVNMIQVTDSLTAPLLGLKLTVTDDTIIPEENRVIVYVDKDNNINPTDDKKAYVFDITNLLSSGDIFEIKPSFKNNDVVMITEITRQADSSVEEIEYFPIMLFEGNNYIYTNYANINIELIYPKDTIFNRNYLNNSLYYLHKMNNNNEFSLDDIYFKDAFTKTENKLNLEVNNATVGCLTSKNNKFSLDDDGNLIVQSLALNTDLEVQNLQVKTISSDNSAITMDETGNITIHSLTSDTNVDTNTLTVGSITSKNNNFSLDANGNLSVNSITTQYGGIDLIAMYPVGSIYMSVNNVNPSTYFGGTWESWGVGKTIVGVDTNQTEFNTVEKTGGEKTHTLSVDEIPAHSHGMNASGNHTHTYTGYIQCAVTSSANYTAIAHKRYESDGTSTPASMNSTGAHTHTINNTGSSLQHNNLQPYITCYMWKRTA